jgi:hypothetical protein
MYSILFTIFNYSVVGLLVFYSKTVEFFKRIYYYYYNSNEHFKSVMKHTGHLWYCLHAYVDGYKIEPFNSNWICTSVISDERTYNSTISYKDYYEDISEYNDDEIAENMQHVCENMKILGNNIIDFLITIKRDDKYYYYVSNPVNLDAMFKEKSRITLLSIKYTHPKMTKPIFIELNKKDYNIGNHLLSAVFIKRYLEYQSEEYYFDFNYKLVVLDCNVMDITLNSSQYVLLNDQDYEIITR